MRYITDHKRATGLGSAGTGTTKHWFMQVTAVILAVLVPIFLYLFGSAIGFSHAQVVERFSNPFTALLTAAVLVVGLRHFAAGTATMIEDYFKGGLRKALIILTKAFSYGLMGMGLYALVRFTA